MNRQPKTSCGVRDLELFGAWGEISWGTPPRIVVVMIWFQKLSRAGLRANDNAPFVIYYHGKPTTPYVRYEAKYSG